MTANDQEIAKAIIAAARERLAHSLSKIEHCLNQLNDEQLWWRPQESQNSIANLLLHLCGNVRQWLVAGISGVPDVRNRPKEFSERGPVPKTVLIQRLEEVVSEADATLRTLTPTRLLEKRRIQGFDTTVLSAIFDTVPHFSGHTQEIVFMTRFQLGDAYQFKWVPATPEQGSAHAP